MFCLLTDPYVVPIYAQSMKSWGSDPPTASKVISYNFYVTPQILSNNNIRKLTLELILVM